MTKASTDVQWTLNTEKACTVAIGVKLSLSTPLRHIGGVEVQFLSFLTSALDGSQRTVVIIVRLQEIPNSNFVRKRLLIFELILSAILL